KADSRAHVRIIAVVATTLPRNADVAEQLELLADLLEIEGEAAFRVLAYRRAATRVRDTGGPVAQLALDGEAKKLPGIGARLEENVLKSVGRKKKATGPPRTLLGRALPALLAVVEVLREHPAADRVSEAGSARRRKETVRDLDIIATANDPKALIDYFTKLTWVSEVAAKGPTKATVASHEGCRFDLRVVPPDCYGNLLQHFTGSKDHNIALREDAVRRGLSISEYGVTEVESGEVFTATTEAERGRGYAYYAITDHSHYLREGRMEQQAREIDKLAGKVAPLKLLKGVEVNIKADGTLDVTDETLAGRDWVVASIHTAFDRSPTERILGTME